MKITAFVAVFAMIGAVPVARADRSWSPPDQTGQAGKFLQTNGIDTLWATPSGSGSGTVTNVSVATSNGFSGTVSSPTTTPVINLNTTITGILKGNGTAISGAIPGTDYLTPTGSGTGLSGIVTSAFGRTGIVVANSGDYDTSLVPENGNLYFTNARAIASTLTGYISGAGTISSADSILSAVQKLNGNIGALTTGVSSVSNSDGSLIISPSTGVVIASLNPANPNTWTAKQIFNTVAPTFGALTTNGGIFFGDATGLLKQTGAGASTTVLHGGTNPSFGAVDLTADITGTLPIVNGGTNSTGTPTAGGVSYGTGTAFAFSSAGTTGQALISNGTTAPTWSTLTTGVSSVSNSDGTLTISPTTGAVVASLNLTQPNTWLSALQTFNHQALTTSITPSVSLTNTTNATTGTKVQNSPALLFEGRGWTGSASQVIRLTQTLEPSTTASQWKDSWDSTIGASTVTGLMTLSQGGSLALKNNISAQGSLSSGVIGTTSGSLFMDGSTSGQANIVAPAAITNYTLTLPTAQGAASTFLQNDGAGNLSWAAGAAGANTALSNLASVAINSDLLPGVSNTINLGNNTNTYASLVLNGGSGSAASPDLGWYDSVHMDNIGFHTSVSGTQELLASLGGEDDVLMEDNGGTPFLIAGLLANKKIGNIGGSVAELSGLEAVSDGTGEPNLVLIGSPAAVGTSSPQHYWQQYSITTNNATPTDAIDTIVGTNSAIKVHWSVVAFRTGGTGGTTNDTASWDMTCTYKNISGTAVLVGSCHKTADKDNVNLDIAPSISSNIISLMATGDTNNNYSWHTTAETEYGN